MVVQDEFRPHELERQSPQQQDVGWVSGVDVIDPGPPGEGDEDAGDVPRRGGELAGVGADRADSGGQAEAVDRDAVDDLMSRVVALLEAQFIGLIASAWYPWRFRDRHSAQIRVSSGRVLFALTNATVVAYGSPVKNHA